MSASGTERISVYDLTLGQLEGLMAGLGQRAHWARRVWRYLYRDLALSFGDMADLPPDLRSRLAEMADLRPLEPVREQTSADGMTTKVQARLTVGASIESVLMRYQRTRPGEGRTSVCVSTQVGCAVGCPFCATGEMGFIRNLTPGEIVAQVLHFARRLRIDNVVFMGMGEPLLNYESTWRAVETLSSPQGFGLGPRRFTVSTSGIVPGIRRLAQERLLVHLAVSLHAPNDELRRTLVPISKKYPLPTLMAACDDYTRQTGRRIGYQYVLLAGVNDGEPLAHELGGLLHGRLAHVNLIPVNPAPGAFQRPSREAVLAFQRIVQRYGVRTTIRAEKGVEISAACGQLATGGGPAMTRSPRHVCVS